jgi:hypothetical protein
MKKSLISLMEGSPTKFFDDIRAKLAEKANSICESVATEVAPEVFEESAQADRDENVVATDNAKIQDKITNKKPEKIKKLKGDLSEEVEQLDEISKERLGRYVKSAHDNSTMNHTLGFNARRDERIQRDEGHSKKNIDYTASRAAEYEKTAAKRDKGIRKAVDKLTKEEVEPVKEDMGAHTISTTRGGKNGKSFTTFVVNKKRRTVADKERSWKSMIMKATPKETEWDKHVKGH